MSLFHELWQTIQQVVYSSADQTQLTNNTVWVLVRMGGIRFVQMGLFLLATLFHPYWWRCLELRRTTQPPTTVISFSNSTRYTDNVYNTAYSSPGPDRSLVFFHRGSKTADKKEKRLAGPLFRQKHDARCEARNNVTVQLSVSRPAGPTMAMKSSMSADWQRCCWWHLNAPLCTEDVRTCELSDTYNNWETTVVCKNTATLSSLL